MTKMYNLAKVDQSNIIIDQETFIGNINVRYSLTIPLLNRRNGLSLVVVLMNPSEANVETSDSTVNKLIDFFYDHKIEGQLIKEITICNVLPIYASNTKSAKTQIRALHEANILEGVQKINEAKLTVTLKDKRKIVLGWGKPEVKTIPNLFYYKEVLRIVNLISILQKDDLYVFDIKNSISTFTEHGDPRHSGRSVKIDGLKKISISKLFGLE